jgi:hypothetical protein
MKQLIITSNAIFLALVLSNCSSSKVEVTPSQNSELNKISKSNASRKKPGAMQRSLDSWLKDDWEPTVSKDKKIQQKYMQEEKIDTKKKESSTTKKKHYVEKKDKNFTLQEYVDKASAYMEAKPTHKEESNVKKMESLPVIGK